MKAYDVLSVQEAAELLGIHRSTVYALIKRQAFPVPVSKVGALMRISREQLEQFIKTGVPITRKETA